MARDQHCGATGVVPDKVCPFMNLEKITRKISDEFQLLGCFLLEPQRAEWVGGLPADTFQGYLNGLFKSKEPSYFSEIRFFKYNDAGLSGKVTKYVALLPIDIEGLDFGFLGLIYENQDQFQELLKFRILPMYLVFYLFQALEESRMMQSEENGPGNKLLVALEEKRVYAQQLEMKVRALSREIDAIKNSEMSLDQKVEELSKLLEKQNKEYAELARAYQDLFDEAQAGQREMLQATVAFEHKILDMEVEKRRMKVAIRKLERGNKEKSAPAGDSVSRKEYMELGARLRTAQEQAAKYSQRYESIMADLGGLDPKKIKPLLQTVRALREKVEYFRARAMQDNPPSKSINDQ